MATSDSQYDTIIIGGGVSGCASARKLAQDQDVLIIDKGQIAGEASGLAAGLVAPTLFYSDLPEVAQHANQFFRDFHGTNQFEFTKRDRIEPILPENENEAREEVNRLSSEGFPITYMDTTSGSEKYPYMDLSEFCGIIEYRDTGWVDPYTYTISLKEDAIDQGADVQTSDRVKEIIVEDHSVEGVKTESGTYYASNVVVAAGWRTKDILSEYIDLPYAPFKLQCITLEPDNEIEDDFPLGRIPQEELYFRPEKNGTVLFGGGEYINNNPSTISSGGDIDGSFRNHVAITVPEFLEGFENAKLVNGWSGVDTATPDARPIIDSPDEVPDGIIISGGFNGLGMVSSPVAATAVRSLVTGEPSPFPLDPFSYDRFETIPTEFKLHGTFGASNT